MQNLSCIPISLSFYFDILPRCEKSKQKQDEAMWPHKLYFSRLVIREFGIYFVNATDFYL